MPLTEDLVPNSPTGIDIADAFLAGADRTTQSVGLLLSVALTVPRSTVEDIAGSIWPQDGAPRQGLEDILTWPFVIAADNDLTMLESVALPLATHFREHHPDEFRAAHGSLADFERSREDSADPRTSWFARSRTTFYVAAIDPDLGGERFGEAFEEAPSLDRTASRLWLSDLVMRQGPFMDRVRVASFFRGFRNYIGGDWEVAADAFDSVIGTTEQDLYRAIALHLRAVVSKKEADQSVIDLLSESVQLSSRLGLPVNEVMARHSLAWVYVRKARSGSRAESQHQLGTAVELAERSVQQSVEIGDKYLVSWCNKSVAQMRWMAFVGPKHDREPPAAAVEAAPGLIADLSEALSIADAADEVESALLTLNEIASIHRDLGQVEDALWELADARERASSLVVAPGVVRKLRQTAQSVARIADPQQRQVANELEAALEQLHRRYRRLGR
jgi:hypothetical protein